MSMDIRAIGMKGCSQCARIAHVYLLGNMRCHNANCIYRLHTMNSDLKTASTTPLPPMASELAEEPNSKVTVPVKKASTPRRALAAAVKQLPSASDLSDKQPSTPSKRRTAVSRPVTATGIAVASSAVATPQSGKLKTTASKFASKPVPPVAPAFAEPTPPVENVAVLLKPKKAEKVRNSFSVTPEEDALLDVLKRRAKRLGKPIKKTDLVRAGIKVLIAISDKSFLSVLGTLSSPQEDGAPPAP